MQRVRGFIGRCRASLSERRRRRRERNEAKPYGPPDSFGRNMGSGGGG